MSNQPLKPSSLTDAVREFAVKESQSLAGRVISEVFGPFAKDNPKLWTQRTFLLLVTKIYEQLVIDRQEITPKDFLEWARSLSEVAKSGELKGSRQRSSRGNPDDPNEDTQALAGKLESVVREIYGTNLHLSHDLGVEPDGKKCASTSDSSHHSG